MAFAVMATMLSNVVLSHGLWTFYQATGWAAIAFVGSKLSLVHGSQVEMKTDYYICNCICTLRLVGFTFALSSLATISDFGIYLLNGLPFDAIHAIASIASAVCIAPYLANLLHVETASMEEPISLGEADVITA